MIRTVHIAKFVLPEAGMLLRNAAVHVCDPGRISRLEPSQSPRPNLETRVINWGSAIILPGFVNTHTHLELTRLHREIPRLDSLPAWIAAILKARQGWTRAQYLESCLRGARMALSSGTTLIGDISTSSQSWEALKSEKIRKVVFEEVISLEPDRASGMLADLEERLNRIQADEYLSSSVSPHAPYSVSPELFRSVAQLAQNRDVRLATHVAETRQELAFLRQGDGEFRDFLSMLGALPAGWKPPGVTPVRYLDELGVLGRPAILIHCNYLDDDSIARILSRSCSVVYCPRSHEFFGHDPHPVRRLLDVGINVALGTDSLASNDSLSILDEMRFLFRIRKDLKCEEIFRMATLNGAVALGFGGLLGRLRRGSWADMTVLRLPENVSERHIEAQILEGAGESLATVVHGEIAWTQASGLQQEHIPNPEAGQSASS